MNYRSEIDGLRALAVLPVIFFHAGFNLFDGGFIGVDIFFVISGYLITSIIINEIYEERFTLTHFYERRARRILPALILITFITIPFAWFIFTPYDLVDFGQSLISTTLFSSNILFWREDGYFATASELKPLIHTWSLAIEEQFYILYPLFILLVLRFATYGWLKFLLSIILIFSLILAQWTSINNPSAGFFLLPTRGWELLLGALVALYLKNNEYFLSKKFNQILSLLGFIMILISIFLFDESTPTPSLYTLIPTIGTSLIILSADQNTFVNKLLSQTIFTRLGLISYSAYLWHHPIFAFYKYINIDNHSMPHLVFLILLTLILSWITWKFVEKPFRNITNFKVKNIFFGFALISICFLLTGIKIIKNDGNLQSYSQQQIKIFKNFDDPGKYSEANFKKINLKLFDKHSHKRKVLILGDSFAGDIVNAVYSSNLINRFQLSGYRIRDECKKNISIIRSIDESFSLNCLHSDSHLSSINNLFVNADEVWLASSSPAFTSEVLSIFANSYLGRNTSFRTFGSKDFGLISSRIYKNLNQKNWTNFNFGISNLHYDLLAKENLKLKQASFELKADFIDVQELLCDGEIKCSNFNGTNIITYDGNHLTSAGASILGRKLERLIIF